MRRSTFLGAVGAVGLVIGTIALFAPSVLLVAKGVAADGAAAVWMREVGVLVLALTFVVLAVRREPDSRALRAVLWGNALVHAGLFPIEIVAWHADIITRLGGIAPNSLFHVVVASGFVHYARRAS